MKLKPHFLSLFCTPILIFQATAATAFPELGQISEADTEPTYVQVEGFEAAIDANSIEWDKQYLKVVTVATEYEALVIYDCQEYRSAELAIGDGTEEMQTVQQPIWNIRDTGFLEAVCNTANQN